MEPLQPAGIVADQPVPVIVAELVAEMAEQRAVVLAHLDAHLFSLGGIGLGDVERDQAVVVAGQHMLAGRRAADQRIGEEIEGDADLVAGVRLWADRQAKGEQRIDGALLGRLDPDPALAVACDGQVGNGLVQRAGAAEAAARLGRPVAAALGGVEAGWYTGIGQDEGAGVRIVQDEADRNSGTAHFRNRDARRNAGRKTASW